MRGTDPLFCILFQNALMEKRDAIFFKLATMPPNLTKKFTLPLLEHLEKKYPANYDVKRQIALHLVESEHFSDAIARLLFLCVKHKKFCDVALLMSITFFQGTLKFYFGDMGLLAVLQDPSERALIRGVYELIQKYQFSIDLERPLRRNHLQARGPGHTSPLNEYEYNRVYSKVIERVDQGDIAGALALTQEIFRVGTHSDSIQFMVENEKVDLLFQLSSASRFFRKYYDMVVERIHRNMVSALEVVILNRSKKLVRRFLKIFKRKRESGTRGMRGVRDDEEVVKRRRYSGHGKLNSELTW